MADNDKISHKGHRAAPRCCRCPFYVICYSVYCRMTKNARPPMELNLHGERAFCVFVRFWKIHSACGYRLTHGLAPQQADAEPVHCFIATDSWSTPLSSKGIIYHSCGIARQNWFTYNKTLDTSGLYWMGDSVLFFTQLWLWYHLKDQPHPPREKRKTGLIL